MAVNGDERLNPLRTGFPVCDTVGGLNAAFAVMAALFHRERTGEGQFIDIALLDSIMPLMGWVAANLLIGGQDPVLMGNDNFTAAPSGTFRTQDGFINIAANKQEQWEAVCDVLGVPELKADPRFQERDTRKKNRKALTPLLEARLPPEATALLGGGSSTPRTCPRARSSAWRQALRQPQVQHRRRAAEDRGGRASARSRCSGSPPCSRRLAGTWRTPPPTLGQHNAEIYARLGLTRPTWPSSRPRASSDHFSPVTEVPHGNDSCGKDPGPGRRAALGQGRGRGRAQGGPGHVPRERAPW